MKNGIFRAITDIAFILKPAASARRKPRGLRTQAGYESLEKRQLLTTILNAGFEAPGDYSGLDFGFSTRYFPKAITSAALSLQSGRSNHEDELGWELFQ